MSNQNDQVDKVTDFGAEGMVRNYAFSLPFQMQDTSKRQCKRETVYSCQTEDGFVFCMTDAGSSVVPISLLI